MSWNTIKLDKADKTFSEYIRRRDKRCVRCGRSGEGEKGILGLQCSHYWSRRHENTRFDPLNCDALCAGCHMKWGGDEREFYKEFKIRQLGEQGYKQLMVRSQTYKRKDRKMEYIIAKELLKGVDNIA